MRASLFFSRDFPHQATQRFGEYFLALSLGLPMEPFSIRQTACCRIFLLMFQHKNRGQAAPYGRGTEAPQSRPQQGFRLPGATCAAGWRTALQKKSKAVQEFPSLERQLKRRQVFALAPQSG